MIPHSSFTIVGLGNPGKKYEKTRHNAGRMTLEYFRKKHGLPEWERDAKRNALISKGEISGVSVELLLPETFMNNSGNVFKNIPTYQHTKILTYLVIIHDDIDLPLGSFKIAYNRGSAGHKGVESIIAALGTKEFTRVRIGIAPRGASGAAQKPAEPERFVLQKFSREEKEAMQKVCDEVCMAIESILKKPPARAPKA